MFSHKFLHISRNRRSTPNALRNFVFSCILYISVIRSVIICHLSVNLLSPKNLFLCFHFLWVLCNLWTRRKILRNVRAVRLDCCSIKNMITFKILWSNHNFDGSLYSLFLNITIWPVNVNIRINRSPFFVNNFWCINVSIYFYGGRLEWPLFHDAHSLYSRKTSQCSTMKQVLFQYLMQCIYIYFSIFAVSKSYFLVVFFVVHYMHSAFHTPI